MAFRKCPRCELNYITDREKYCKVCLKELHGDSVQEETELCTVCNERPVVPGKDICSICLKEMQDRTAAASEENNLEADAEENMREIVSDMEDEGFEEMENELSLDQMGEDEARQDDELESEEV